MLAPDPPQQVILVTAPGWDSQRATLRRFERTPTGWSRVGESVPAWIGSGGFAPARTRMQNTGTTPAGVFSLPEAFGTGPGRHISLPYHRITPASFWPYDPRDPRTYNVLQTRRTPHAKWRNDGQWSERLQDYGRQYSYAAVIGYNLPETTFTAVDGERRTAAPADTRKGGGIFLHVTKGRPTAGCVAIARNPMRTTLQWLDPVDQPVIVMGPRSVTRGWRTALLAPR